MTREALKGHHNAGVPRVAARVFPRLGSVSKGDCPPAGGSYFRGIGLFAPGTVPFLRQSLAAIRIGQVRSGSFALSKLPYRDLPTARSYLLTPVTAAPTAGCRLAFR